MTSPAWLRHTGRVINSNSTTILSATAVAGVIATAVLSVKAANKIAQREEAIAEPTPKQYVQQYWRDYIPPAVAGLATIGCIIGANRIGLRRQAALLGAYTLVDTAFREYKDEVIKQLGEAKERKVVDEVAKRQMDENPPNSEVILVGGGEQLCYDTWSGRYFKSDVETIRQAANTVNENIIGGDMSAELNAFWTLLGLDSTRGGDEVGFNLEHLVKLEFTSHLTPERVPCLAITYTSLPVANYGQVF